MPTEIDQHVAARRRVMAVLARTRREDLGARMAILGEIPSHEDIRRPETGLVMLRGRIAGSGAPFNLGEASVTRAAVRLASGESGFSYLLGRDAEKARAAALVDALWQREDWRECIESKVIAPLARDLEAADIAQAAKTAATRVDFFTLVRGED